MKFYEIKYSVDFFPEKVPDQLANEADLVFENSTVREYQTEIEDIGLKRYTYNTDNENLTISAQASQKYLLSCVSLITIITLCIFTDFLTGMFRDAILLFAGVMSIIFGCSPIILSFSQPDVIYVGKNTAKIARLPYYRQVASTVSRVHFILLIFGLAAAWPWIMPNFSLIPFLILITVLCSIYVIARTSPKEQTTPALLFLLVLTGLPVWIPIGSLVVYTQYEGIRQQGAVFLEIFQGILFTGYLVQIYEAISSPTLIYILLANLILAFFGASYAPKILDKIMVKLSANTSVNNVHYNKEVHLTLLILYTVYFLSNVVVFVSYLLGNSIIQFRSHVDFVTIFAPGLVIGLYFVYYRSVRYIQIRKQVLSYATKQTQYDFVEEIDIVTVEGLEASAFSVDLYFSKERVVVDRDVFEALDRDELAAVYFHELYHIEHQTKYYQQFVNVPIIGPIFFLALIDPEEVFSEEFRADECAAEKIGIEAVISAIETVAEIKQPVPKSHNAIIDAHSIQELFKFITTIPIVGIYRPTRRQRIQRLKSRGLEGAGV